jgi:FAD:protein FMN transferase
MNPSIRCVGALLAVGLTSAAVVTAGTSALRTWPAARLAAYAGLEQLSDRPPTLHRQARRLMGTLCEIQAFHHNAERAADAMTAALDEMQRVDRLLSNYAPDSELSEMNRAAAAAPVAVSAELFAFVRQSAAYLARTRGAFDPTLGPLVRAWGFTTPTPARPSSAAIADARARSGFDKVRLDAAEQTVSFAVPGMEIDPGGIGKGYAVDRAVEILARAGITAALVSAGGSTMYAIGRPPGRDGWRVAISDPTNVETPIAIVTLRDASISTSGVSHRSVSIDGRRFSHVFDPRTGKPVEDICQATVVATSATASDALSTAAFILSRADIAAVLEETGGAHALRLDGACGGGTPPWITPWSEAVFQERASALPPRR